MGRPKVRSCLVRMLEATCSIFKELKLLDVPDSWSKRGSDAITAIFQTCCSKIAELIVVELNCASKKNDKLLLVVADAPLRTKSIDFFQIRQKGEQFCDRVSSPIAFFA